MQPRFKVKIELPSDSSVSEQQIAKLMKTALEQARALVFNLQRQRIVGQMDASAGRDAGLIILAIASFLLRQRGLHYAFQEVADMACEYREATDELRIDGDVILALAEKLRHSKT